MRSNILLSGGMLLLAGCGGEKEPTEGAGGEAADAAVAAAPAVEKPDIDCDDFKPRTAPDGQPADDILGLRPGMSEEEVRGVLLCKNANYAINTNKNSVSLPDGGQMSQVNLNADTGLDKVSVWLLGPDGGEKVVHVDRTTEYPAGKELPVENVAQEVATKYGAFDDTSQGSQKSGWIVRSRDGQRMTNTNSNYGNCRYHNVQTGTVSPCLHAISYEVAPSQQNPALAQRFNVAMTSQAMTSRMVDVAKQGQAKAVERAKENAAGGGVDL
ncbi:MAG: hypothetical protein ABWZ75_12585 [Novosphingobium sp.]